MKIRLLMILALALTYHTGAYSLAICDVMAVDMCNGTYLNGGTTHSPVGCLDYTLHKVTGSSTTYCYYDCTECTLDTLRTEINADSTTGCTNSILYHECSSTTLGGCGSDCTTTRVWEADGTGYESRVTSATCQEKSGKCTKVKSYRCAVGYWGSSTTGTSGCTACGNGATTQSAGSTSQSDCYISSGNSFSDATGSGTYTGDCYY